MKANELRIGNLVFVNNIVTSVESVDSEGINMEFNYGEYGGIEYAARFEASLWREEEKVKPIPLTEEWLVKLGFVNGKLNTFRFIHGLDLTIEGYEHDYNGLYIGRLEHVHQLQNLYFALTGEELTTHD